MAGVSSNNLRFGGTGSLGRCSVLVVSPDTLLAKELLNALLENNAKLNSNVFQINSCQSVLSATRSPSLGHSDYIVILVKPSKHNWSTEVEENIALMDKAYLCSRFCLVVDTQSVSNIREETLHYISILRNKYSVTVLYGEFDRPNVVDSLSQRLLNLVNGVCCNSTGLPINTEFVD